MDDPQVDDYVRWGDLEDGYFKDPKHYLTIEIECDLNQTVNMFVEKHKYIHTLVCCYPWDWNG